MRILEINHINGVLDYKTHGDPNLVFTGLIISLMDLVLEGSPDDVELAKLDLLAILNNVFDDEIARRYRKDQ